MKKISIIVPLYNEEKRAELPLKLYLDFFGNLKKQKKLDFEIIAVLNGCKDNTLGVVKKFNARELRVLDFKRAGKGFAITEGFKDALKKKNDFIGFVDGDGSTPPEAFYDLIKNIANCDGVIANRWDKKSNIGIKQSFFRRVISRVFNFIARSLFLLPHHDTQCGAKIFKRGLIEKVVNKLGSSEWSFDVDLLFYARRENAKIKSIPTKWIDKKQSNINLKKTPIAMFLSVMRLRLIHSPFRFIVKVYRILPEKIKFHK